jgi:acyl-coenzyme A thioesterase PaaI-like protein
MRVASLHLSIVRPGPGDGPVRVRTRTSYRGRTAAVVGAEVLRADGKPCAIGTATCAAAGGAEAGRAGAAGG